MGALALSGCATRGTPAPSTRAAVARTASRAPAPSPQPFQPLPPTASPKPASPAPFSSVADATRLQVFLDRANFGPGKIDGRGGEFTRKALARYGRAHGLGTLTVAANLDRKVPGLRGTPAFTDYTVTTEDAAEIGILPEKREEQGKGKALPYTSLLELVAERFHAEQAFLRKLNPGRSFAVGERLRVPAVNEPLVVPRLAQHGKLLAPKPALAGRVVLVHTREKMLDVRDGPRLLASFPITPGSATLPAPPGTWKIVNQASMPYFRYDEAMLNHGVQSAQFINLPPGPNSPVGVAWMGLNKRGIGLHGTSNPETIGRAASHGCIRLANWDAVKLSQMVTVGGTVKID